MIKSETRGLGVSPPGGGRRTESSPLRLRHLRVQREKEGKDSGWDGDWVRVEMRVRIGAVVGVRWGGVLGGVGVWNLGGLGMGVTNGVGVGLYDKDCGGEQWG